MSKNEVECSQAITTPNSSACLRLCINIKYIKLIALNYFLKSPCVGLVISGYSKTLPDESWVTYLAKAINPYKKFKKMYTVDTTGEFQGKIIQ